MPELAGRHLVEDFHEFRFCAAIDRMVDDEQAAFAVRADIQAQAMGAQVCRSVEQGVFRDQRQPVQVDAHDRALHRFATDQRCAIQYRRCRRGRVRGLR